MASESTHKEVFFGGLVKAFKEQWQVDIRLKPGDDDNAIPAHKVILAARSKVFRDMLESDECKASQDETITLSELKHEELKTFLEFLYNGSLSFTELKQHVRPLYLAADKYEIPYLQDLCRNHLISNLNSSNALDVLELSDIPSDKPLNEAVSRYIIEHMDEIAFSQNFKPFVEKNPSLAVEIMQAFLNKTKDSRLRRYYY
ncbi:PREDICTED: putative BTB/POZ domain-containing protein At2g40440 [Tarenaya hassleriana]|uniref:putative BTB/POZ domain-containing protein At2g40440 n=1 Tax=Tarenaya hassleriana TaxID=28532 RepID=UPI00053C2016|nr:PREDICTED: putative BTB/POZ domain-containing protein At2g40440 [Tarenaya hassleriana]XP_010537562.1 PREDICTED: putative BTB/POZ domain-containing protein At2g40440 [Tarenaya hassleriana]XP_010537642.1 PREDICTED: putative BTB/POZ domain-containing protein At2g40440 [Tarenaya hassleriana]XP_010537725.1 PREDICTED: putative BTB/POZ domain-containing protein At2g40440 [Tarenaya hassleriana]